MADDAKAQRPRRILYVENGIGYGGAVICLRHLVRNLDRSRFEPIVVTGKAAAPYSEIERDATWVPIRDRLLDTLAWQRGLADSRLAAAFPRVARLVAFFIGRIDDIINFAPFLLRLLLADACFRASLIQADN